MGTASYAEVAKRGKNIPRDPWRTQFRPGEFCVTND